ncbi:MAG: cytidine deaminase [Lachnospiraceae bacterium]|nr:cytidine deaminase [Lachnospiraceae bacterium]
MGAELSKEEIRHLIREAMAARENAYAPYSHYKVGAAILAQNGDVTRGCNVENASYSVTICGERNALFAAVARGERSFRAIALTAAPEGKDPWAEGVPYPSPCGVCRQALSEFTDPKTFAVILARSEEDYRVKTLEELLPDCFSL